MVPVQEDSNTKHAVSQPGGESVSRFSIIHLIPIFSLLRRRAQARSREREQRSLSGSSEVKENFFDLQKVRGRKSGRGCCRDVERSNFHDGSPAGKLMWSEVTENV